MPESQQSSRGQEHQDLSLVTNTLRLCLALKQSPTLRRQLQTYALDSVRSAATRRGRRSSELEHVQKLARHVEDVLHLRDPQLQQVVKAYLEGGMSPTDRDDALEKLWVERKKPLKVSVGHFLGDTVDSLRDEIHGVTRLLGLGAGTDEVQAMLSDPPAFSSAEHGGLILSTLEAHGATIATAEALTSNGEVGFAWTEQDLDALNVDEVLATLRHNSVVNLDLERYWHPRPVALPAGARAEAYAWLMGSAVGFTPSGQSGARVREMLLADGMPELADIANLQSYRSLLAAGLEGVDSVAQAAREQALLAVAARHDGAEAEHLAREMTRTQSKIARLREEVMGDESAAEVLEDNDAVVLHQTRAIEALLAPVERKLADWSESSLGISQAQHNILLSSAAFDRVASSPAAAAALLRFASDRLSRVGLTELSPLEELSLQFLNARARPYLDRLIKLEFLNLGAGDAEEQQWLQSAFDMQVSLAALVERLDAGDRRLRRSIVRKGIVAAANSLFSDITSSLARPFGPEELEKCCKRLFRALRVDDWAQRGEVFREGSVRDRLSHAVPVRLYSRPHRPYIRELARLLCLEALKAVPEGARGVFRAVPDPEAAAWLSKPMIHAIATCQATLLRLLSDLGCEGDKLNLICTIDQEWITDYAAQRSKSAGGTRLSARGEDDRTMPAPSIVWAVEAWISNLSATEDALIRRLIEAEKWVPSDLQGVWSSSSARDLIRLLYSHVQVFFSLQLPAPAAFSRAVEKVWAGIGTYLKIVHSFCDQQTVVPPRLPLRKPAVTPSEQEIREEMDQLFPPDAISVLSATSLENVVVMLNDLLWLRQQCEELDAHISTAWVELCATDPQYEEFSDRGVKTSNYQMRTIQVALDMIYLPSVIDYLGARVAYFELRAPFLGRLFSPTVARSPLSEVIQTLNAVVLPTLEAGLNPEVGARVYEAVCRWCLKVLLHILLDGGRIRSFHASEAGALNTQLAELLQFFASHMAVPESALEQDVRPVVRVLHWMAMDYRSLRNEFEAMPEKPKAAPGVLMPDCKYRIIQVLARRASDSQAQRFVKKRVKDFDSLLNIKAKMKKMNIIDGMTAVLEHQRSQSAQPGRALAPVIADIPTDVVSGVVDGAEAFVHGIVEGVSGVVADPVKGAREGGFSGAIKGVGHGLTGLLTEPAKGTAHFLSETTAGLLNTPATLRDMLDSGEASEFRKDKLDASQLRAKHTRALTAVRDQHEWQKQLRHLIADFNFNNSRDCTCVGIINRSSQENALLDPEQESGPRHFFLSAPRSHPSETAAARPGVWDPTANTSLVVWSQTLDRSSITIKMTACKLSVGEHVECRARRGFRVELQRPASNEQPWVVVISDGDKR